MRELVDVVFVAIRAVTDLPQDAAGEAAFEVGAIGEIDRAREGHAAVGGRDVRGAPSAASSAASAASSPRGHGAKKLFHGRA